MSFGLNEVEGKFLVNLARRTIVDFIGSGKKIPTPSDYPPRLSGKCGVFVTLSTVKSGVEELRGCIGYPEPILPLIEATIDSAVSSATQDPRFPPISSHELNSIIVEISVLTPPTLIIAKDPKDYLKQIKIGRDGLIVERGMFRGLLLPQVPVEWKWDLEEYLANCCMKAGLAPDTWLVKGTRIYSFQAIIFKEKTPNGEVEQVKIS